MKKGIFKVLILIQIMVSNSLIAQTDYFQIGSGISSNALKWSLYSLFIIVMLSWLWWVLKSQIHSFTLADNDKEKDEIMFVGIRAILIFIVFFVFYTKLIF